MGLDGLEQHPARFVMKWAVVSVLLVLVLTVLANAAGLVSVWWGGKAAKINNPARVEQKVYDPNNTIAQIAFFHNTCNTAAAQLRIVKNNQARARADEHAAQFAKDPIRQQQAADALTADQADVTGAQNALQTTVADYNSRSAQSTANVFKGHDLPRRIELPDPIPADYSISCN